MVPQVGSAAQVPPTQTPALHSSPGQQDRPMRPQSTASVSQVPAAVQTRSIARQVSPSQQGSPSLPQLIVSASQRPSALQTAPAPVQSVPSQQGSPMKPQEVGSMQVPASQLSPASQRSPSQQSAPRAPQVGMTAASAPSSPPSSSTTVDSPQPKATLATRRSNQTARRIPNLRFGRTLPFSGDFFRDGSHTMSGIRA